MKWLFTTAMTTSLILSLAILVHAQGQEHRHEPGRQGPHRHMMEGEGMHGRMMGHMRMMMNTEIDPRDPTALLANRESLELTEGQAEQLQALVERTRREAAGLLNENQRQQLEQLPQQPRSMRQMHGQMMQHMEVMQDKKGMCPMCAMMKQMHDGDTRMKQGEADAQAELDAKAHAALDQIVTSYLTVQQRLAADEIEGVADKLMELHDAAHALMRSQTPGVREKARAVAETVHDMPESLDEARKVFKALSAATLELVKLAPPSDAAAPSLYAAHCPMAEASWLQSGQQLVNPYMGPGMLRCGTVEQTLKPGGQG